MSSPKTVPKFLEKIASLCADNASLQSKIGLISLSSSHRTPIFDKLMLLYEYLQLFCPVIIFALSFQNAQESQLSFALFYLARFSIPSYWIVFSGTGVIDIMILALVGLFTISKYLLLLWIAIQVISGREVHQRLQRLWQSIFSLQGRVFYFFTTSFFISAVLSANADGGVIEKTSKKPLIFLTTMIIIVEFAFSIALNIYYHYVLPTKKFLSSKSNTIEILTLIQKLLVGILIITLEQMVDSTNWTLTVLSCSLDIIRNTIFFTTLPLYNFKALSYQANLLMIITSLDFGCLILLIIKSIDPSYCSLKLLLVIVVLLSCYLVFLAQNFLQNRLFDLLFNSKIKSPMLLIHRVHAIQQLEKFTKELDESKGKHRWTLLANRSLNSENIQKIFGIEEGIIFSTDINSKESLNLLLKEYLKKLTREYPSHTILQFFAAKFFAKKFKLYSEVVTMAKALREKDGIQIKMNAELILIELQNIIKADYLEKTHHDEIDPDAFIREQFLLAELKSDMLEQAQYQLQVYEEIKQENSDIFGILQTSQKVNILRNNIAKQIKKIMASISEFNLEPLNLCAQYSFALNHSISDQEKLLNIYSQRLLKYRKIFNQESLVRENVFQNSVGFNVFSGSGPTTGNIVVATKPLEKVFGGSFSSYVGSSVENRLPPIVRSLHEGFFKSLSENKYSEFLNKITRGFGYTQERFIVEVDFSLHIHPFVTHGFNFIYICRPVVSNKDFVLLYENGDIDCTTKNIEYNLGIQKYADEKGVKLNLKDICPELSFVNEAFNIMAELNETNKPMLSSCKMTEEKAKEIYDLYTTTGKDILFSSVSEGKTHRQFSYHCKVSTGLLGAKFVKTITLTENKRENQFNGIMTKIKDSPQNKSSTNDIEEEEEVPIDFEPFISPIYTSLTTRRNLLSEATPRNNIFLSNPPPRIPEEAKPYFTVQSDGDDEEETNNQESNTISYHQSSKNGSTTSKGNQQRKVEVSFKAALNKKTTSKAFRSLCSIFYLSILILIISQVTLRQVLIQNTRTLKTRKDILRNAQLRNILSVSLEGIVRVLWEYKLGIITPHDYPPLSDGGVSMGVTARTFLKSLVQANQELLRNVGSFDQSVNELLFQADIRIHDTYFDGPVQSYKRFDTFQATDLISNSMLTFLNYDGPETPEADARAEFIYRNTLNDMILKNEDVVDLLGYTLAEQHENAVNNLKIYRNTVLSILSFSIVGILIFLWRVTLKQERNLSALCRINGEKLQTIEKRCRNFQEIIENDKIFDLERGVERKTYPSVKINNQEKRGEKTKNPNTKSLYRNLKILMVKLVILLSVFYAIIMINYISSHKAVDAFNEGNIQIRMNDYLQVQTALAVQTFRELISTNDTASICNVKGTEELPLLIHKIRTFRTAFFQSLLDSGALETNAEIHQMLLGDACKSLDSTSESQCQILKSIGKKTGLIYLLSDLENELNDGLQAYFSSDKSTSDLAEMKIKSFKVTSPVYVLASRTQTEIGNFLNQQTESLLAYTKRRRNIFLGVFMGVFVVVGALGWIFVIKELKEGINNFKNVLKLLPAELVLSSFILKTFLMKTSRGALDSVKHSI